MTNGASQGLFVIVSVVIFGVFVGISYLLFDEKMNNGLATIFNEGIVQANKSLGNKDTSLPEDSENDITELVGVSTVYNRGLPIFFELNDSEKGFDSVVQQGNTFNIKTTLNFNKEYYEKDMDIILYNSMQNLSLNLYLYSEGTNYPLDIENDYFYKTKYGRSYKEIAGNEELMTEYSVKYSELSEKHAKEGKEISPKDEDALVKYFAAKDMFYYMYGLSKYNFYGNYEDNSISKKYNSMAYQTLFFDNDYKVYLDGVDVTNKEETVLKEENKKIKYVGYLDVIGMDRLTFEVTYDLNWEGFIK